MTTSSNLRARKPALAFAVVCLAAAAAWAAWAFLGRAPKPGVTPSGRQLTALCAATVNAHCKKRVECGQLDAQQMGSCVEEVGAECERAIGWKIRAGVVAVGGEPQDECLEAMGEASCNALQFLLGDDEPDLFEITDRCEMGELLAPRSALAAPCAETSDCTAGYCPGLAPACHRCQPFLPVGAACKAGVLECDAATGFCAGDGRCAALLVDGARCSSPGDCKSGACRAGGGGARVCGAGAPGASCAEPGDCAARAYCQTDGGRRACAPRAKTGERCTPDPGACQEREASCLNGVCRVRPFLLAQGAACREFTDCKDGLYCRGSKGGTAQGTCEMQLAEGAACAALDFGACPADAACRAGRCSKLKRVGERCGGHFECKAFASCVPSSLEKGFAAGATCVAHPREGEACNQFLPCVASFCDAASSRCVRLGPGGAACAVNDQCESRWCVPGGAGQGGTCYAPCAGLAPRG